MPGLIILQDKALNTGSRKTENRQERRKAIRQRNTDSPRNCAINCFLEDPITFLMPTSLALSMERAVVRLMKLMPAIIRMNAAMTEKIATLFILPLSGLPYLECR